MKMIKPCWRPFVEEDGDDSNGQADGLLWYKNLGPCLSGEFSMAVVQANALLEDQSQVESGLLSLNPNGPCGTFVGVYDGHGGPETSRFVNNNLFLNLKKYTSDQKEISSDVIRKAFLATEEDFLSIVKRQWLDKPLIASVGTCCLVGVISNGLLYIANAGDSRAVLGKGDKNIGGVMAIQLSTEHNVSIESVRDELRLLNPDDPQIVVQKHKVWRVKGIIQISRSIGDAYLKKAEFNREPLLAKFRVPKSFSKPILSADPSILVHKLNTSDQFVIFASDGLWEHLSNQEAVDVVTNSPRNGIAKRLVKTAMRIAAKKREMRYSDLKKIERGVRRHFHDDITVVVIYFDEVAVMKTAARRRRGGCEDGGSYSVRGWGGVSSAK
ncbi:probable protein phosphatase 2C 38 [Impatiens glandulifera]|uniref:probable protein phosphatase 2C 38 n=1 Tax=Impatiens glandulifera TaxID=253017 RepID=UPI001FB13CB3|nr:probable protein phosphatase 2C 38 [Impatiens glandulifera]XP_047338218.1 probable protein phosphatase 2C 38 [Impatiens glandulifera]